MITLRLAGNGFPGEHNQFELMTDNLRPAGFSATVSNYSVAYVANVGTNGLSVVSKGLGTCDVTIFSHSQDGTPLPNIVRSYTVDPAPVPQANNLVVNNDQGVQPNGLTTPSDPGTDTVVGSL